MRSNPTGPNIPQLPKAITTRSNVVIIEVVLALLFVAILIGMFMGACEGPAGPRGIDGPAGEIGITGPVGETTVTSGPPGPEGDVGQEGVQGVQGAQGEQGVQGDKGDTTGVPGEQGDIGPQGPVGPPGELAVLNAPPSSLNNANINHILFFASEGIYVENPGGPSSGGGAVLSSSRRNMDFSNKQGVRVQWAHTLENSAIKLGLQFYRPSANAWLILVPVFGDTVAPRVNQASAWYGIPQNETSSDLLIRAVIEGDGELDPRITYVEVDAR